MKILVTGAFGLIGSNLCRRLTQDNHEIHALDNGSICSVDQVAELHNQVRIINADAASITSLRQNVDGPYDAIIHLAALKIPIGPLKSSDVLRTNIHGTENILELAAEWGCRIVIASTSDVYGKSTDFPFTEATDLVIGSSTVPRWAYAASKLVDEHLALAFHREERIDAVVIRYFNSYGPRHDISIKSGGPQALFIDAFLEGRPITLYGDGSQQRAFCYIDDTVEGTVGALMTPEASGKITNIGNPDGEISIKELAYMIYELMELPGEPPIKMITHEKAFGTYEEVQRRIPDISLARQLFGFEPKFDNREGLKRTIEWQRNLPQYKKTCDSQR